MTNANPADNDTHFVTLLTQHQHAITLVVRALMPGEAAVDEVVQQSNAKLWQKRDEFESGTNFKAWASAVTRFEVLNYRKRQARDSRLHFSDELEQQIAVEMPVWTDELSDRQLALRQCLDDMSPDRRELLLARYGDKEKLADVAKRVGRPVGSIKVTLSRMRGSLAECIERRLGIDGGTS
ncbi:MAG: sigma-70 family RNA polymerase sigma factor [Planctomycetota bacterium]